MPALVIFLIAKRLESPVLSIGFALGLASHLLWDTAFYGNVQMIPGGNYDRLFLLCNSLLLLGCAVWFDRKLH